MRELLHMQKKHRSRNSQSLFLMKELFLWCVRLRMNSRKLIFAGAMTTVAAALLHLWFLSHPLTVSSYNSLNGSMRPSQLSETLQEPRIYRIQHLPANSIISQNSSIEVMQSVPVEGRAGDSNGKRWKTDDKSKVIPTPPPPSPRSPTLSLQRYIWTLTPIEALLFAKKEIDHAPIITEDAELYAPLFRNISVFKRSYELMEMTLRVYIYSNGKRPIFHHPYLRGIYASEGWFMKLMRGNKHFVTEDPEKAHLFYLPYSVRQLQLALYVPNSHSMKPLTNFLRDYVNMIAAKYPFWNRTHGSDHFFVACHDWGPYTTVAHTELKENAIKVLCNADLSEGIFVAGKDVSLPETTIKFPKKPQRHIGGGNRVSQRPILAFFAGYMHGRVRPILLKYWKDDEDMKIYRRLPHLVSKEMSYIQHMKSSRYCICPMGYEVNSPRIVEAIYYECVPVIIADNFVLPFSEVLDWSAFSVVIPEKDIPKLKEILLAIPLRKYLEMQVNVKMVQKHFVWHPVPIKYDLFHMVLHSIWFNRLNQIQDPQSH